MNVLLLREIEALRRIAGRYIERLRAKDGRIENSDGLPFATFRNAEVADYLIRLHNVFIPLTNAVVEMCNKLRDRENLRKESNATRPKQ
jgi:hypothetical protein